MSELVMRLRGVCEVDGVLARAAADLQQAGSVSQLDAQHLEYRATVLLA